jgi:hypothetical protein
VRREKRDRWPETFQEEGCHRIFERGSAQDSSDDLIQGRARSQQELGLVGQDSYLDDGAPVGHEAPRRGASIAGLTADDAKMTKKDLQKWIEGASCGWVAEFTVPWVASASPHGREIALKWIESKDETIASAGWQTYSSMAAIKEDADLDLAEIKSLLQRVAKSIHQQPNRVKYG